MTRIQTVLPLTPLQGGLLFDVLAAEGTGSDAYLNQTTVLLEGDLDPTPVGTAFADLVQRHDSLRVAFAQRRSGEWVQVVTRSVDIDSPIVDRRSSPPAQAEADLQRVQAAWRMQVRDARRAPLVHLGTVRLPAERTALVLTHHHLVLDGWSTAVLIAELVELVRARAAETTPDLPTPIALADVVSALRRRSPEAARQAWADRFRAQPAPTALAPPPVGAEEYDHAELSTTLAPPLAAALATRARECGVTSGVLLQAAWGVTVATLTGRCSATYATTVAGRPTEVTGVEQAVGAFSTTVPAAVRWGPRTTVRQLLVQAQQVQTRLDEHVAIPLAELLSAAGSSARFDTAVVVENYPVADAGRDGDRLPGGTRVVDVRARNRSAIPLTAVVTPGPTTRIDLEHSRRHYPEHRAPQILQTFIAVLTAFAADLDRTLASIDLRAPEDAERWAEVGHGGVGVPAMTGWELFERVAASSPDALAIDAASAGADADEAAEAHTEVVTYGNLRRRALTVAAQLEAAGVRAGDRAAVWWSRDASCVASLLGVWQIGAVAVPLAPDLPTRRAVAQVADAQCRVLLLGPSARHEVPAELRAACPVLDVPSEAVAEGTPARAGADHPGGARVPAAAPAYVMFTSGSTGRPKGVVVSHLGLANLAVGQRERFAVHPGSRVLQFASAAFDGLIAEVVSTLAAGAVLVLRADRWGRMPGPDLARTLARDRISHLTLPPSAVPLMPEGGLDPLETLVLAGEASSPAVLAKVPGHIRTVDAYGPSEATVCATASAPLQRPAQPCIGRPLPGVVCHVLDQTLRPVPEGAAGELYLAGPSLALGYLDAARTAESFVADPFAMDPAVRGRRMYRTGDVVRWSHPTGLQHLGRTDGQVEVRGQRVEMAEVEKALTALALVRHAVVTAATERPDGPVVLTAHVQPAQPGVTTDDLGDQLRQVLPAAMVPARWRLLAQLPTTVAGKVDRLALASQPAAPAPVVSTAERSPVQSTVRELFSEVLGTQVEGNEDFFSRGGHSLSAVRLATRLSAVFDMEVAVSQVFELRTPEKLAEFVGAGHGPSKPLRRVDRRAGAPLSPAQERLWFLQRLNADAAYNLPLLLTLAPGTRRQAVREALDDVVARHEVLRSRVLDGSEGPRAWADEVACPGTAAATLDVAQEDVEAVVAAQVAQPFDLTHQHPLRAVLLEHRHDGTCSLLLTVHHIAFDASCLPLLARDLHRAYLARAAGAAPAWEPLPLQYADAAAAMREDGEHAADEQFWSSTLAGTPGGVRLPWDTRPVGVAHGAAITRSTELGPRLHDVLVDLAQRTRCTPFIVLHAAVAAALHRLGAGDDIVVGTSIANRHQDLQEVIGLFLQTLVLRTAVDGSASFTELVGHAREADLAAFAHHRTSYEKVVTLLGADPAGVRRRGVNVAVDLVPAVASSGMTEAESELDGGGDGDGWDGVLGARAVPTPVARFDLAFAFALLPTHADAPRGLHVSLTADGGQFEADTVDALLQRVVKLIGAALSRPHEPVGSLPLLPPGERSALLARRSAPCAPPPAPAGDVVAAVDAHGATKPDHPAVRDRGRTLRYGELAAASRRTAAWLRGRGARAEDLVAVAGGNRAEGLVAIVAVLRAGAGFVPVDVDWPAQRLAHVLHRTRPVAVLAPAGTPLPGGLAGLPRYDPLEAESGDGPPGAAPSPGQQEVPALARSTAYVLFTSGSTGVPKGVVVEREALRTYLAWGAGAYPEAAGTALLHTAPTFDLSLTSQLVPLVLGGTISIADLRTDDLTDEDRPDFMKVTPSHLPLMTAGPPGASPTGRLVVGGEQLVGDVLDAWRCRYPGAVVTNDYGPTETTVNCIELVLAPDEPTPAGTVAIGVPLPGNTVLLLDRFLEPVPPGVEGELYVGGGGLARGYDLPTVSAHRFVCDPHGLPGERIYRTGDLAVWRNDGSLQLTGRADRQVKVRGHRVELDEVEAALSTAPAVGQVMVLLTGASNRTRLDAFAVVRPLVDDGTGPATPEEVRQQLRAAAEQALPRAVRPSRYVLLPAMPLTTHGKVDAAALRAFAGIGDDLGEDTAGGRGPGARARSHLEERVCRLVADVLRVADVAPDDDFFDRGGHSLLALQLVHRMSEALGVEVPLSAVFATPTPAGLVAGLLRTGAMHDDGAALRADLDALLPAAAGRAPRPAAPSPVPPRTILLTGATGFLGSHLLAALLADPSRHVVCLVRGEDDLDARSRLAAALTAAELLPGTGPDDLLRRVTVWAGDLTRPHAGLDGRRRAVITESVDAVVHSAAAVGFLVPYPRLREANVLAVAELLRMCEGERPIAFHHISTSSCAVPASGAAGHTVRDGDVLALQDVAPNGYVQSKWVAEQIVLAARAHGVRATVHRPGRISAARTTGVSPVHDALWTVLDAVERLGAVPREALDRADEMFFDLVAVDDLAAAMVSVVDAPAVEDPAAHDGGPAAVTLTAARPIPLRVVLDALVLAGRDPEPVAYEEWIARLEGAAVEDARLNPDLVLAAGWPVSEHLVRYQHAALQRLAPDARLLTAVPDAEEVARALVRRYGPARAAAATTPATRPTTTTTLEEEPS